MVYDLTTLIGSPVVASDGEAGRARDFLFDDQSWLVRYLVVDVGNWVQRRDVVLPVTALEHPDWDAKTCRVRLTRTQVKDSPDIDSDKPIWRQQELATRAYYGPLACWVDAEFGFTSIPLGARFPTPEGSDPHLRSTRRLVGYEVRATDGDFGRLQGIILDDGTWHLCYLEVETLACLHHRVVPVPTSWVGRIWWGEHRVYLGHSRGEVKAGFTLGSLT